MINQLVSPIVLAMYMRIIWTKEIRNSKFELFPTTVFWLELEGRQKERKVGEEKRRGKDNPLFFLKEKKRIVLNLE